MSWLFPDGPVLVVTGSRLLGNSPVMGSGEWAEAKIRAACAELARISPLKEPAIVHGDAEGCDAIANRVAMDLRWRRVAFTAGGKFKLDGLAYADPPAPWKGPLERNTALVKYAVGLIDSRIVRFLALGHYLSQSGGTYDALRKMRKAGLLPAIGDGFFKWQGEGTP